MFRINYLIVPLFLIGFTAFAPASHAQSENSQAEITAFCEGFLEWVKQHEKDHDTLLRNAPGIEIKMNKAGDEMSNLLNEYTNEKIDLIYQEHRLYVLKNGIYGLNSDYPRMGTLEQEEELLKIMVEELNAKSARNMPKPESSEETKLLNLANKIRQKRDMIQKWKKELSELEPAYEKQKNKVDLLQKKYKLAKQKFDSLANHFINANNALYALGLKMAKRHKEQCNYKDNKPKPAKKTAQVQAHKLDSRYAWCRWQ